MIRTAGSVYCETCSRSTVWPAVKAGSVEYCKPQSIFPRITNERSRPNLEAPVTCVSDTDTTQLFFCSSSLIRALCCISLLPQSKVLCMHLLTASDCLCATLVKHQDRNVHNKTSESHLTGLGSQWRAQPYQRWTDDSVRRLALLGSSPRCDCRMCAQLG